MTRDRKARVIRWGLALALLAALAGASEAVAEDGWEWSITPYAWLVLARGDFSFGDSDLFWTAQLLGGWRFGARQQHTVLLGYRHREMEYEKGPFEVERTLSGAALALRIGF